MSHTVVLTFHSKASYNKFLRSFDQDKGMIISPKIASIQNSEGQGLFDSAMNLGKKALNNKAVKNVVKQVGQQAIQQGVNALKQNDKTAIFADVAGQLANQQLNQQLGYGLFDSAVNLGKNALRNKAVRGLAKQIGTQAIQQGTIMVGKYNPLLASVGSQLAQEQLNQMTGPNAVGQGFSFGDFTRGVEKVARKGADIGKKVVTSREAKNLANIISPAISTAVGQTVAGLSGDPIMGAVAGQVMNQGIRSATGQGLRKGAKRPKLIKGSAEAKAYMAAIRAKKGGSIRVNKG